MVVFYPAEEFSSGTLSELRELQQTGALCDVTLTIGQARLPAHRCVLAVGSHYFRTLFLGQFKEAFVPNMDVSVAEVTDDFEALELVVKFLYTGKIEIDDDNVEVIVKLSTFLLIDRLTDICIDYISDHMNLGTWLDRYLFAIEHGLTYIESKGQCIVASRFHDYFILEDHLDLSPDEVLLLLRNDVFQHCTVFNILRFIFKWLKCQATAQHTSVASQLLDKVDLKTFDCLPEQLKCDIKETLSDISHFLQDSSSSKEELVLEKLQAVLQKLFPELETGREHLKIKSAQSCAGTSHPPPDHEAVIVTLSPKQCIVDAFECREGFFVPPTFTEPVFTLCCYKPRTRTWYHIQDFETEEAIADLPKHLGSSHTIVPALYKEELVLICNDYLDDRHSYVKVYFYNLRRKSWRSVSTPVRVYYSQDFDKRRCVQDYCITNGNSCIYLIFKVLVFDREMEWEPDGEFFLGCRLDEDGKIRIIFETETERNHACLDSEIQAQFSHVSNELIFSCGPKVDTEGNHSEGSETEGSDKSVRGYNYVFVVNLSEPTPTIENLSKVQTRDPERQLTGVKILQTPSHFYIVYDGTAESFNRDIRIVYLYKLGSLRLTRPQEDIQDCLVINQHFGPEKETFPCCEECTVSDGKTLWSFDGDRNFFSNLYEVQVEEDERFTSEEHTPPPFSCVTRMTAGQLPVDLFAQMTPIRRFLHNTCKIIDSDQ